MTTILAVDGGNSKTDVALVRDDGALLGYARGGESSPHSLGVGGSLDVVEDLTARLCGDPPELAVLLLAGIDFPDEEDAYGDALAARGLAGRAIVGNDTFAVLRAGTERPWGVAVTCGAGINCVGVAPDGRRVRFPSLGAISGDWGGGSDVGLAAVYAAARGHDGRGPRTVLEQVLPAHFGLQTPVELARALQSGRIDWERLRELAPVTLALADEDPVAGEIVDRLAAEVVAFAGAALRRLELLDEPVEVVLGGGLLQAGNERLDAGVEAGLAALGDAVEVRVADAPPVVGAALVGLDELGAWPEAQRRLRAELGAAVAGASWHPASERSLRRPLDERDRGTTA